MDKFLALKMFVATVDAKGFSQAARNLSVAPSTITRIVDALEAELGTVLLNRSTRQVTVSEAGMTYYVNARKIIDSVLEADELVKDSQEEVSGPLRVTVPMSFGRHVIAPHLGSFLHRHPKLDLDIVLTDDVVDLSTQRIDVSIRLGSVAPMEDLVSRKIGAFKRLVIASSVYIHQYGQPHEPADLLHHQCLRYDYGNSQFMWTFLANKEEQRIPVKGKLKSNNVEVLHQVALGGQGIALLPEWLIRQDVIDGRLMQMLSTYQVSPNSASSAISAIYLPNHRGSKRTSAFIDFVTHLLKSDPQ
ncbi:LysR family transcriptional regulator [Alteromonas pelagimontana]|uniref:LysR family transcriptional regulator n=1 Tax=Alteromonas pelagimontana TaxID=1858656 RepID=A0A6M4MAC8_9ALTE|nr:LysR family transcriptional regulator [Alteromonas pelagimontana]QJR80151.1 LysR family transcriptional regulator [Alteromonas pelagimontana]